MNKPDIDEVKAHLGFAPRTAQDIAESTGMQVEGVYEVLVHLHDRGEARIEIEWASKSWHKVHGWCEGVAA